MTIYRSSGKNTEICEEYELYTRNYVENVGGKSTFTAKGGTTFGDKPETAKPLEITNLYVKVRLSGNYNGEFGFDWVDVNPETKEIEKIQDVSFSEVEYFYKKGVTPTDLGNIVEKSTDPIGAKHAIQDHYNFNPISKYIDIPFALIKCDQEITLSAEIILWQGEIKDDIITITGDEFYEFEIIGGEKEGKTAKIKLTKAGVINFKVKCLEEGTEKKYEFKHSNPITGSHSVGGITMMENKELKLKFRVIALVSSDGNPSEKAKALFKKFKDNGITKYLNENSLNQAGYQVEIENEQMFKDLETADLDDYFYAFDKENWKSKSLFKEQYNKKRWEKIIKPDGSYELEPDGKHYKMVLTDSPPQPIDVIGEDKIDYKSIELYKLKLKNKFKMYNGGIIILADYQSQGEEVAFSRPSPLFHYALFMYSNGIERKDNYSHEIGHMLGLPHLFYKDKEKEAYKSSKDFLLGNGLPEKNPNGTNNDKYRAGLTKMLNDLNASNSIYQGWNNLQAIKQDIIDALLRCNRKSLAYADSQNAKKTADLAYYIRFGPNDRINYSDSTYKTKKEHFEVFDKNIDGANKRISQNNKVIQELRENEIKNYENIEQPMWFVRTDLIILLKQQIQYNKEIINQTHSNYIMFK
ncbi:MAG: hypothetical protein ABI554_07125 [Flavobacterium sp.]